MSPSDQPWDPCPEGEIGRMVGALRAKQQRKTAGRVLTVVASLAIVVTAVSVANHYLQPGNPGANYGGIHCTEVAELLPKYRQGEVDEQTAIKIAAHLDLCPHCRRQADQMQGASGEPSSVQGVVAMVPARR